MAFYEQERSFKAWFEYAEPGLLTNRTIRNFLTRYRTETWPDVVKLTFLYGIVSLRQALGDGSIPLTKIRAMVRRLEAAHCVEAKLSPIREKMQDLKGDVQEILDAFEDDSAEKTPRAHRPERRSPPTETKPATPRIYPDWWGDGAPEAPPKKIEPRRDGFARQAPRLCYSVPKVEKEGIDFDDVVEPKYYVRPNAAPKGPLPRDVAAEGGADVAASFLNNRWTSALCQSPIPDPDVALVPPEPTLTSSTTSGEERQRPDEAFWIDFGPNEKHVASPPKERRRRGCVLDFGHLDDSAPVSFSPSLSTCSTSDLSLNEESVF